MRLPQIVFFGYCGWYSPILKCKGQKFSSGHEKRVEHSMMLLTRKSNPLDSTTSSSSPLDSSKNSSQYSHWNFFELMTWFLVPSVIYYTCNYSVLFFNFKNYTSMVSKYYLYIDFLKNNQKFSSRFIPVCPSDDHIQHPFWT